MNKRIRIVMAFLALIFSFSMIQAEILPPVNNKASPDLSGMLKNVMPAVVNIYVQGELPPGHYPMMGPNKQPYPSQGMVSPKFQDVGSGVIVDAKEGYVITNAHVVRDAQSITVTLNDGRRLKGHIIGADNPSDIAVIKINPDHLETIPYADSDQLEVGDYVAAIGSPFGLLTQTVTSGVISALNRSDLGIEGYENFIQTDAPINPGNSGGALVNMKGQLVGINTAIIAPAGGNVGIGFAIPSNMAKSVVDQLIRYGKVERGLLGVAVQNLTPDLADALNATGVKGALITQVNPGSPAAKADLRIEDVVTQINGKPITNAAQLRNTIGLMRVGSAVALTVLRNGKTFAVTTTIVPQKEALAHLNAANSSSLLAGVRLRDYNELNFNAEQVKGIEVLDLDDNSAAALKGLRPGDVILAANNQFVGNIVDLTKIANSNPKRLLLEVQHESGGTTFMVIDNN